MAEPQSSTPSPAFLERQPIRRALRHWRDQWLERHQHPASFALHLVGIPLALLVAPVLLLVFPWDEWYWAAAAFVAGYLLQWLGHCIEGNDLGEWAGIKRMLGLPYVGIAPRYQKTPSESNE